MKSSPLRYSGEIAIFICALLSIAFMFIFNNQNAHLRYNEIRTILAELEASAGSTDHSSLITQYRLAVQSYRKEIDPYQAEIIELRASMLFSPHKQEKRLENDRSPFLLSKIIELTKIPLGKKRISEGKRKERNYLLETAYYFEKNGLFSKAIDTYEKILTSGDQDPLLSGGVLLHQGFCLSMNGRRSEAKRCYEEVIERHANESLGITATVLLQYLLYIDSETIKTRKLPDSPQKAEKLFHLATYPDSLEVIHTLEKQGRFKSSDASLIFFKARCMESTGNTGEALKLYRSILEKSKSSKFAQSARRRIFLISIKTENSTATERISKLAIQMNDKQIRRLAEEKGRISKTENQPSANRLIADNIMLDDATIGTLFPATESPKTKKVTVILHGGDLISGTIIRENETTITVQTAFGEMQIRKENIQKIENK